jgi:hypothetical protein
MNTVQIQGFAVSLVAVVSIGCGGATPSASGPGAQAGCTETAVATNDHVGFETGETIWEASCPAGKFHCTQQETGAVACAPANKKAEIVGIAPLFTPIAGCTETNVVTEDHAGFGNGATVWQAQCAGGNMQCAQSPTGVIACTPSTKSAPIVGKLGSSRY